MPILPKNAVTRAEDGVLARFIIYFSLNVWASIALRASSEQLEKVEDRGSSLGLKDK